VALRAWFLNLDADAELGHSHAYTPGRQIRRQIEQHLPACAALTLGEPVCGQDPIDPELPVYCWCPTPNALGRLARLGLRAIVGPDVDALRRANDRAWTVDFAEPRLARCLVTIADDWGRLLLEAHSPTGTWRLKRRFGFAGRGHRRLRAVPSADDLRWVDASLGQGGLLREAELPIHDEFSIHGYVDSSELLLGTPVSFSSDAFGAPAGHSSWVGSDWARELSGAATRVASRLLEYGYFGPFGVDAFSWRSEAGVVLNPVSDVNARFTLAWSTGMGHLRERALQCYLARCAGSRAGVSSPATK